ncbi:MAG TPA: hypothetical protein VGD50_02445 [Candidatus Baltobacteraceae bacterium]
MSVAAFALLVIATSSGRHASHHGHRPAARATADPYTPNDLYSPLARRRMVHYLRLRLMELNAARLERVAKVVRGELSLDDLLKTP